MNRPVALESAASVEHRRVDHPADADVDVVRAESPEHVERVASLQHEFAERRLVEHDDVLAARALLLQHMGEPSRRAERRHRRALARGKKVLRALPVHLAAEDGTLRREPIVERRTAKRTHRQRALRAASASRNGARATPRCGRRDGGDWRGTARSGGCRHPTSRAVRRLRRSSRRSACRAPPASAIPAELKPAQTKKPASSGASPRMKCRRA